ncbi:hypothetical protein CRG98_006430 [Punica granatum]|uniref:Uncharacterized protein n=1 Tax=Punica granatum TaxID=22663 RepID=A0A2I0KXJ5_PUNGR|nr:hypothetical protein CRG98_006430 [Punica granatum]
MEALLAEIVRSLDYVREVWRGRMRGSPHLLQIWLLAHVRPFCSSHPFSYITDERLLIERLVPVIPPPEHSFSEWRHFWRELTPAWTFPPRRTAYPTASSGPTLHPRPPQDSYRFERSTANGTLAPYSVCTSPSIPPTKSKHSPPHQHTWPGSIRKDRHRRNGPRTSRLPELHLPPLPKPKAPPKRLCVQSYGPSGRSEIGFVASSSTLARRSRTTGSFRRS